MEVYFNEQLMNARRKKLYEWGRNRSISMPENIVYNRLVRISDTLHNPDEFYVPDEDLIYTDSFSSMDLDVIVGILTEAGLIYSFFDWDRMETVYSFYYQPKTRKS